MTPNHRTNENSDTVNLLVVLGKKDILFFFFFTTHRIPSPSCSSITTEHTGFTYLSPCIFICISVLVLALILRTRSLGCPHRSVLLVSA